MVITPAGAKPKLVPLEPGPKVLARVAAIIATMPPADAREYGSPADVASRIEQYIARYGRENTATLLLYEAMRALRSPAPAAAAQDWKAVEAAIDAAMSGVLSKDEILALLRSHPVPAAGDALALPELNANLIDILGRPNFACIRIAQLLRRSGVEIDKKAEAEQATVIHYLLGFYLKHGSKWAEKAGEDLERRRVVTIVVEQGNAEGKRRREAKRPPPSPIRHDEKRQAQTNPRAVPAGNTEPN